MILRAFCGEIAVYCLPRCLSCLMLYAEMALACCSHEGVFTFEIVGGESEPRQSYLKKQVVLVPLSKSTKKCATASIHSLTPTSHLSYPTVTLAVQPVFQQNMAQSQTLRPWALDTVDVTPKYPYSHGCGRLRDSRVRSCQR